MTTVPKSSASRRTPRNASSTRAARRQLPAEGALLRLIVTGADWPEAIPPVPDGHDVSVSFSSASAAAAHADALESLGYRLVGIQPLSCACRPGTTDCGAGHPRDDGLAVADFLVSQALLEARPAWWRTLADQADRAYNLAVGPVLGALQAVLGTHLDPVRYPSA